MKKIALFASMIVVALSMESFCGFYVAQAGAELFNKASEVILVRDGNKTTITMSNDFQGSVKDFAMVVPVPVVLKENQIKVVESDIFDVLDQYSGPRLTEYFDDNPCVQYYGGDEFGFDDAEMATSEESPHKALADKALGVKIEARYNVGEYEILILSAKESSGLETWLKINKYQIPKKAKEVLDPYVKSNTKFFVAKVNLEKASASGISKLRPIQIHFESDKFMLPIRLGMANAIDDQELIIYAFTKSGRIESTNYFTTQLPTDKGIPVFAKANFGKIYKAIFDKHHLKNNSSSVVLEYAWNLNSDNYSFCDPCSGEPPRYDMMAKAGVDWVEPYQAYSCDYKGEVFFTRLHVRYNRKTFPQDLSFQVTPNTENYQVRFFINHQYAFQPNESICEEAKTYLKSLPPRREAALTNLTELTGWDTQTKWSQYIQDENFVPEELKTDASGKEDQNDKNFIPLKPQTPNSPPTLFLIVAGVLLILVVIIQSRRIPVKNITA